MERHYKSLILTDDIELIGQARKQGRHVVPCLPLKKREDWAGPVLTGNGEPLEMSDFPYVLEKAEEVEEAYLDLIDARLCGYPLEVLRTKRCIVREIRVEDVEELYRIYSDPEITRYMEGLYDDPDQEKSYVRDYIRWHYGLYGYGMWIVTDLKGRIIGRAGFEQKEDEECPELGFMIRSGRQREGLAYEVCSSLLLYARDHLKKNKLKSICHRENVASRLLLEKLGFSRAADRRETADIADTEGKEKMEIWVRTLSGY